MVDELAWGVQTLAAMAEETRGVGFGVEVQEEGPIHNSKTAMEYVKTVLEFSCTCGEEKR